MRIIGIVVVGLDVLVVGFILHTRLVQNPRVLALLEREPQGERAGRVLVLGLPSGKTGQRRDNGSSL